jgi:hypothetical protein
MAYVDIKYKKHSFEENPGLVTWVQLYVLKYLREQADAPAWTRELIEEWDMNSQIDIYKYFFHDTFLDNSEKEQWAIAFLESALSKLNNFTLQDFGNYIGEEISPEVDYERLKKILLNVKRMVEDKEPVSTTSENKNTGA